jgi:hypothetical protein
MVLLSPRTSLHFKTKSLHINHVRSYHFISLHFTSHQSILCPIVVFDELTSENTVCCNDRILSGMTLRDWASSYRSFGETFCPQCSAVLVTNWAFRWEGDTAAVTSPALKRHIPVDHILRRKTSNLAIQGSFIPGRLIFWLLTPCRITDLFRSFSGRSKCLLSCKV